MDIHWWWLLGIYVYYLDRQTAAVGQTSNRTHLVHAARESASVYNMHALNGTLCGHVFCVPRRLQFACAIWKHLLLETCHNERGGRVANTLWARFFFLLLYYELTHLTMWRMWLSLHCNAVNHIMTLCNCCILCAADIILKISSEYIYAATFLQVAVRVCGTCTPSLSVATMCAMKYMYEHFA